MKCTLKRAFGVLLIAYWPALGLALGLGGAGPVSSAHIQISHINSHTHTARVTIRLHTDMSRYQRPYRVAMSLVAIGTDGRPPEFLDDRDVTGNPGSPLLNITLVYVCAFYKSSSLGYDTESLRVSSYPTYGSKGRPAPGASATVRIPLALAPKDLRSHAIINCDLISKH